MSYVAELHLYRIKLGIYTVPTPAVAYTREGGGGPESPNSPNSLDDFSEFEEFGVCGAFGAIGESGEFGEVGGFDEFAVFVFSCHPDDVELQSMG